MSKEDFKNFIKTKPELSDYVADDSMTWQKFYELYDLFGEDDNIWNKYPPKSKTKVSDFMNNLDTDSIQKHIENAQKALNFISELTTKTSENISSTVVPNIERPITKFFGD